MPSRRGLTPPTLFPRAHTKQGATVYGAEGGGDSTPLPLPGVVTAGLLAVVGLTECLEIIKRVGAALALRNDVINLGRGLATAKHPAHRPARQYHEP